MTGGTLLTAWVCGTVMHFLYEPLGRPRFLRPLLPISESVWEHYKMAFWPLGLAMVWLGTRWGLAWQVTACAAFVACMHGMMTMFGLFYLYVVGLGAGRSILPVDIGCYAVTMTSGYIVGLRMLHGAPPLWCGAASAAGLAVLFAMLWRFSFRSPDLPMFRDGGL